MIKQLLKENKDYKKINNDLLLTSKEITNNTKELIKKYGV